MYSVAPIKLTELMVSGSEKEQKTFEQTRASYIPWLPNASTKGLTVTQQKGWADFAANHLEEGSDETKMLIESIDSKIKDHPGIVETLAYAKNKHGRMAYKMAIPSIQRFFQEYLLALGRYDFDSGAAIHKSATCVVIKAEDARMEEYYEESFKNFKADDTSVLDKVQFGKALQDMNLVSTKDDSLIQDFFDRVDADRSGGISMEEFVNFCLGEFGRDVVLKIMRNVDQYHREYNARELLQLESKFVVGTIRKHDNVDITKFMKKYLSDEELPELYKDILVMPPGDRNLDVIFRSERPDLVAVRKILKDVAEALQHLHSRGLVHGDLKKLNVVRVNGRYTLIDLDASARIGDYIGSKFSSGVLPPELFYCLSDHQQKEKLVHYYHGLSKEERNKRAARYSTYPKKGYVVRSFRTKEEPEKVEDVETGNAKTFTKSVPLDANELPYGLDGLIKAEPSMDVWAFGVLMFSMCTGESLFPVNRDDDIENGDTVRQLFDWTGSELELKLRSHGINDEAAISLLKILLRRDPKKRGNISDALSHKFFNPDKQEDVAAIVEKGFEQTQGMLRDNHKMTQERIAIIHASVTRLTSVVEASNRMLDHLITGFDGPTVFALLPIPDEANTGLKGLLKKMNPKNLIIKKARVCFVCPYTLKTVVGYDVELPTDWVQKYGPSMLLGLQILQAGIAVGKAFGLPIPSLGSAENKLLEMSDFMAEMQGMVVEELGGEEDESVADTLLSVFKNETEGAISSQEEIPISNDHRQVVQKSFEGIGEWIKDPTFSRSGLKKVTAENGSVDFVHPEIVPVFKKLGKDQCSKMTAEEIYSKREELAGELQSSNIGKLEGGVEASEMVQSDGAETPVITQSKSHVANPSGMDTLSEDKVEDLKDDLKLQIDDLKEHLKDEFADLKDRMKSMERGGIKRGPSRVDSKAEGMVKIREGWLQKKSRHFPFLWKERYFVKFNDGSVMYFSKYFAAGGATQPGTFLPSVKFHEVSESSGKVDLELRNSDDVFIMTLRLSKRSKSSISDWLVLTD